MNIFFRIELWIQTSFPLTSLTISSTTPFSLLIKTPLRRVWVSMHFNSTFPRSAFILLVCGLYSILLSLMTTSESDIFCLEVNLPTVKFSPGRRQTSKKNREKLISNSKGDLLPMQFSRFNFFQFFIQFCQLLLF